MVEVLFCLGKTTTWLCSGKDRGSGTQNIGVWGKMTPSLRHRDLCCKDDINQHTVEVREGPRSCLEKVNADTKIANNEPSLMRHVSSDAFVEPSIDSDLLLM